MKRTNLDHSNTCPSFGKNQLPLVVNSRSMVYRSLLWLPLAFLFLFGNTGSVFSQGSELYFDGLLHISKGQAVLEVSGDTALLLTNIGSSGNDGADVLMGETKGFGFDNYDPDPFSSPVGAFKQWTMIGNLNGQPNQVIWTETREVVNVNGKQGVRTSFNSSPMGATENFVRVFDDNGALVIEKIVAPGQLYTIFPNCCEALQVGVVWDALCVNNLCRGGIKWDKGVRISFPDGTQDSLIISKIEHGAINPISQPNFCTRVESRHKNVGFSTISLETVAMFKGRFHHHALGDVRFEASNQGNRLALQNMGFNGEDGVEINLKNAASFQLNLAPIFAFDTISGDITFGALGNSGIFNALPLGMGIIRHESTPISNLYKVTPDFSALGSPAILYQVLKSGQLVYAFQGGPAPMNVTVGAYPASLGKLEGVSGGLSCFVEQFNALQSININGNIVQGDELRILVQLPAPIASLAQFFMKFKGIPEAVITAETNLACNPDLSLGLGGDFSFNGNANDASPYSVNGVVSNATLTAGHDGLANNAYHFNGSSASINCGPNNRGVTDQVTICAWVKTTEDSLGQWIAGKYSFDEDRGYSIAIGNNQSGFVGQVAMGGRDGTANYHSSGYSTTKVNDGKWHCVVGVAANQYWEIYVDGYLENSTPGSTVNMATSVSQPFTIGWHTHPSFPLWMNGDIDDLRIYNRALSDCEIDSICATGTSSATKDLLQTAGLRIFPNPNAGTFSVEMPEAAASGMAFRIIGLTGQMLKEQFAQAGNIMQTVQANDLPAGLYFLQVLSEGKVLGVGKFVVVE